MKRKPIWKELNLPPPSKKPSSPVAAADSARLEAAQQSLRANCVRTLEAALSTAAPDKRVTGEKASRSGSTEQQALDVGVDGRTNHDLAEAIEQELFRRHRLVAGQDYKTAARTLVAGLKRNHDLRQRVVSGLVRPADVAALGARELATTEQQQEYADIQERETRRVTLAGRGSGGLTLTSDYTCSRCGGKQCDYLDSGRRDIGKCETWGSKDGQGTSRLVSCLGCGHRWEVDDV